VISISLSGIEIVFEIFSTVVNRTGKDMLYQPKLLH
jgi:hypothetical protein